MVKENSKVFLLILLGMLTAFGPFVTDMYLPSLPSMGDYFSTTSSMVQLGLTTSMIGLAVGQVFFGPLSDRYGRRLSLLVVHCLHAAVSVLAEHRAVCGFSPATGYCGCGWHCYFAFCSDGQVLRSRTGQDVGGYRGDQWGSSCGSSYRGRAID